MKRYLKNLIILLIACGILPVSAEELSFTFSGEIFRVGSDLGTTVQTGDPYTLSVTYDSEAPLDSNVPAYGSYPAISMELEINTSSGPLRAVFASPRIELESQPTYQRITFTQSGVVDPFELNGRTLFNPQLTMFSSQSPLPHNGLELPTSFDRSDYSSSSSSSQLSLAFGSGIAEELIKGSIDSITAQEAGGFDAWSGGVLPDEDSNNDGVGNAVAWVLGASGPGANAIGRLPTIDNSSDPDYFLFSFSRLDEANDDPNTNIAVEYGTKPGEWTTAVDDGDNVIIEETPGTPSDSVVVKLKRSTLAPDGKLFVHLSVTMGSSAP